MRTNTTASFAGDVCRGAPSAGLLSGPGTDRYAGGRHNGYSRFGNADGTARQDGRWQANVPVEALSKAPPAQRLANPPTPT